MSAMNIVSARKDEEYRLSLSDTELAQIPENQAGLIELTDAQMASIGGGNGEPITIVNVASDDPKPIIVNVVKVPPGRPLPITIVNVTRE